jgi:hypothetical protein
VLPDWLQSAQREHDDDRFTLVDLTEQRAQDHALLEHLSERLRRARWNPAFLERITRDLGWERARGFLESLVPSARTARRGQFGEMLSAAIMEELDGFTVPVEKLRYAITASQSQPGADLLALKVEDGHLVEACWVESKLRSTTANAVAVEAVTQLQDDVAQENPTILKFVGERMFEENHALLPEFMAYLSDRSQPPSNETYRVVLVVEANVSFDAAIERLSDEDISLDPLEIDVVSIRELVALTNETFARVGVEQVLDDE